MLPTPVPVVLEFADMWVKMQNTDAEYLDVSVDTSFDVAERRDLVVLVGTNECLKENRIYGDEGYYSTYCWAYQALMPTSNRLQLRPIQGTSGADEANTRTPTGRCSPAPGGKET